MLTQGGILLHLFHFAGFVVDRFQRINGRFKRSAGARARRAAAIDLHLTSNNGDATAVEFDKTATDFEGKFRAGFHDEFSIGFEMRFGADFMRVIACGLLLYVGAGFY